LTICSAANADTIVLTGGGFNWSQDLSFGRLIGPGFFVGISTFGGPTRFFPTGTVVDFSGKYPSVPAWNPAVIDGVSVPGDDLAWVSSVLDISVAPVVPGNTFSTPFSLTGTVTGWATPDSSLPPLFSVNVAGTGTVAGTGIFLNIPEPVFQLGRLVFSLESPTPSPTPEPATLMMLGAGVLIVGLLRHKPCGGPARR